MEMEMTSRALSGQKVLGDVGIGCFPWLRIDTSELAPTPIAAALVVLINVRRFMMND
jgi:hypothetical protein